MIGNPESRLRFKQAWESLNPEQRPLLVYNSGRTVSDMRAIIAPRRLPEPDYIIGGVGTQLHESRAKGDVPEFGAEFGEGWDIAQVEKIAGATAGVERQPPQFLHPYKSSWYWPRVGHTAVDALRQRPADAGLQVNVIYSSLRDLDVLPNRASKGHALARLCKRLDVPLADVLVAGDTGNDSSMFLLRGVQGIVVENAQPELFEAVVKLPVFVAHKIHADGVLEVLQHYGVIPEAPPPQPLPPGGRPRAAWQGMLFGSESLRSPGAGDRDLIATGYAQA